MKIIDFALNKRSLMVLLMILTVLGGIFCYQNLGRLEYPAFTIKIATVVTTYPGATAAEVEQEVTDRIEEEIQKMAQIDNVRSLSRAGLSIIYVEIKPEFSSLEMPQIWDELRRKINDIAPQLPKGVSAPKVIDDFGDVYGVFLSISGDGYTIDELKDYADDLKKELLRIDDVAKISLWGVPQKVIYVEFKRSQLAMLEISQDEFFGTLSANNQIAASGKIKTGDEYVSFRVSGEINSEQAISDLYVADKKGKLVRIGDFATVTRGHEEPLRQMLRFNGKPAVGLGVSTVSGGNVVQMGEAIKARLKILEGERPAGIQIGYINYQSDDVQRSLDEFMVNLLESLLIVIGLLLLTMGWRSGMVIGLTLLLIILGTFIGMYLRGIEMQLVSLGALIIALGMLVDNAIVIVDSYLVKLSRGIPREKAVSEAVIETQWPLLGATVVAILAFMAIGFNPGNIGEFCRSLFDVIAISLLLSWLMAITMTPLLCLWLVKPPAVESGTDIFDHGIYRWYRGFLDKCLRYRYLTLLVLAAALALSVYGATFVKRNFFPDSVRPQFYVDYWRNQASHIDETARDAAQLDAFIRTLPGVTSTSAFVGEGALRFILNYDYNDPSPAFAQVLIDVENPQMIDSLIPKIEHYLSLHFPSADAAVRRFTEGTSIPFTVEARFRGPDPAVLRNLAEQAKAIMRNEPAARYVRDDWRPPVKAIRVNYSEVNARQTGISRADVSRSLQWNFNGIVTGVLREGNDQIPIISRPVASDRESLDNLEKVQIWSGALKHAFTLTQACNDVEVVWEPPQIRHRDRVPAITVQCSQRTGTADELQRKLQPQIESIPLPPLYSLEWEGEYDENATAQAGLKKLFPISLVLMFIVVAMLFRTMRESVTAVSCLPFAAIGVVGGLLICDLPFGFMAILGFLGLSGMLIKNAIVLLDQINLEESKGHDPYVAILNAAVSRLRPVTMAAGTTILGVLPLVFHPFYASMAATIMFGLLGATVLTLIIVPAVYAVLFHHYPPENKRAE